MIKRWDDSAAAYVDAVGGGGFSMTQLFQTTKVTGTNYYRVEIPASQIDSIAAGIPDDCGIYIYSDDPYCVLIQGSTFKQVLSAHDGTTSFNRSFTVSNMMNSLTLRCETLDSSTYILYWKNTVTSGSYGLNTTFYQLS